MNIKPIETLYNNYKFRSRHEARWAVLYDNLNIKWEYEVEGFELPPYHFDKELFVSRHSNIQNSFKGRDETLVRLSKTLYLQSQKRLRYLPDFWFPDLQIWGEVKHNYRFKDTFITDYEKIMRFVNFSKKQILFCIDFDKPIYILSPSFEMGYLNFKEYSFTNNKKKWESASKKAKQIRFEYLDQVN